MIKWFSNFREFYYIQMEKSARQAISDGVTNAQTLAVFRDSELFRTLNMHYNKGNDFEVSTCTWGPCVCLPCVTGHFDSDLHVCPSFSVGQAGSLGPAFESS